MSNGIAVTFIDFKSNALLVYIFVLDICPNNSQQTQELQIAIESQIRDMIFLQKSPGILKT